MIHNMFSFTIVSWARKKYYTLTHKVQNLNTNEELALGQGLVTVPTIQID